MPTKATPKKPTVKKAAPKKPAPKKLTEKEQYWENRKAGKRGQGDDIIETKVLVEGKAQNRKFWRDVAKNWKAEVRRRLRSVMKKRRKK